MAHGEAEHGRARGEQPPLRGEQEEQGTAYTGKPMRWVCGAVPAGPEVAPGATGSGSAGPGALAPDLSVDDGVTEIGDPVAGGLVPRQRTGEPADSADQDGTESWRESGCRPDRPGWAGGHRHGAVRPRVRGDRRERPPDRWC